MVKSPELYRAAADRETGLIYYGARYLYPRKPSSHGKMQREVHRGQAPRDVEDVHSGHVRGEEPHVHYRDGTASTQSGRVSHERREEVL